MHKLAAALFLLGCSILLSVALISWTYQSLFKPQTPATHATPPSSGATAPQPAGDPVPEAAARVPPATQEELDRTVWAKEVQAQKHEETLVKFWDELLGAEEPFNALGAFPFSNLSWGAWERTVEHAWGIHEHLLRGKDRVLSPVQWKEFLSQKKEAGYRIVSTEWHQSKFDVDCVEDCRSVLSDDLDADGKPDLCVETPHALLWLRNRLSTPHHWIGVRLQEEKGSSPLGAQITVTTSAGRQVAAVVTGDSYRSQHSLQKHFGLGTSERVETLEVRWTNGKVQRLSGPAVDRYHAVTPPR